MHGTHSGLLSLSPDTLKFCRLLQQSEASSIYEVTLSDERYCLKLTSILPAWHDTWLTFPKYHDNGDPGYAENGRDMNRFRCELEAYKHLHSYGVCQKCVVPCYYGYVDRLDPALYRPHLDDFANDENHPSAILLEYLPQNEELNCVNYSEHRYQMAMQGLSEIHRARVLHNDPYPRNILIVHGETTRVVWIDFDVSTSYSDDQLKEDQVQQYFEKEVMWARSFGNLLVCRDDDKLPLAFWQQLTGDRGKIKRKVNRRISAFISAKHQAGMRPEEDRTIHNTAYIP